MPKDQIETVSDFDDIKQTLDLNDSYLIFEKSVKKENNSSIKSIFKFLSGVKKAFASQQIYQNQSGDKMMLVIRLKRSEEEKIIQKLLKEKLPKNVEFYIYRS